VPKLGGLKVQQKTSQKSEPRLKAHGGGPAAKINYAQPVLLLREMEDALYIDLGGGTGGTSFSPEIGTREASNIYVVKRKRCG